MSLSGKDLKKMGKENDVEKYFHLKESRQKCCGVVFFFFLVLWFISIIGLNWGPQTEFPRRIVVLNKINKSYPKK